MEVEIREIEYGSSEYDLEVKLRSKILREPLGLRFSSEELSQEVRDVHLGAFSGKMLLGCLVLSPQPQKVMKMRRVAVDPDTQGLGIGRKLVEASEARSRQLGSVELCLNARETAVAFYVKLGYEIYGEPFEQITLPHRKMRKRMQTAP